jgi:hypothetical protein
MLLWKDIKMVMVNNDINIKQDEQSPLTLTQMLTLQK